MNQMGFNQGSDSAFIQNAGMNTGMDSSFSSGGNAGMGQLPPGLAALEGMSNPPGLNMGGGGQFQNNDQWNQGNNMGGGQWNQGSSAGNDQWNQNNNAGNGQWSQGGGW